MKFLEDLIKGLHYSIGISTPPPDKVRTAALIWLVSMLIIIGVLALLLLYVFSPVISLIAAVIR
jgi:hypothetical protein